MQNTKSDAGRRILICVFLISLSLFTYQVALTRLYSAILSYHYVFLTTSFAIFGVGIGSLLAYCVSGRKKKFRGLDPNTAEKIMLLINRGAFLLSCALIFVFILIYVQPFIDSLMIYIALGLIPFIFSGYLFAMLFKTWPLSSGKLYFSDLIGAGVGSVAIVLLLDSLSMFRTVVLISLLPLIASIILPTSKKSSKIVQCVLPIILTSLLFLPAQTLNSIETNFYALLNNTGKTYGEMQRNGLMPRIEFSRWDSFARTDLISTDVFPELKILTIDGGANAPMYVFDGNTADMERFTYNTGFAPFAIGESESALIIGVGGGRGVLYALAAGAIDIAAVEINPASIEAARAFGDFNGHLFDRPEVRTYIQDGRNFVRTSDDLFDVIFLSLVVTSTTQGVGFALSENYIHTVEALNDYLLRLSYNGRLAFVAHDQQAILRLTTTAMQALVGRGIPFEQTPDHIAIFFQTTDALGASELLAPAIIVKNRPFSEEESALLEQELARIDAMPWHIPHLHETGLLFPITNEMMSMEQFIDMFPGRVAPVVDDSPYFFHFNRGIPSALPMLLAFSLVGSLLLLSPFIKKKEMLKPSLYFGLLGMGFMMIQIPLIQKFILYLGHPTPAFSYVLAAMLIGCGIGGFFCKRRYFSKSFGRFYLPPLLAAAVCVVLLLTLNLLFLQTAGLNNVVKIIIASIAVVIPGFFMGMPFPRGMTLLGESRRKEAIPLVWGINGVMSIAGSALSIILSMTFGFSTALLFGAAVYVAVGVIGEL